METAAAMLRGEVNAETDVTRATACLPGLDMEIVHSHVVVASSAFGRTPQAGNRLALFALSARQWTPALQRWENEGASRFTRKRRLLGLLPSGGPLHANRCQDQ
jgi:hypothetical protein